MLLSFNMSNQELVNDDEFDYKCAANILCVTAANEAWTDVECKIRTFDILISRIDRNAAIQLHIVSYAQIVGVILNPDNNEIRVEVKPQITRYSGWFIIRFCGAGEYERVVELLQTKSIDNGICKHIVYEYKSKQQDVRFGLIDSCWRGSKSINKIQKGRFLKKSYKTGWITYKIYS